MPAWKAGSEKWAAIRYPLSAIGCPLAAGIFSSLAVILSKAKDLGKNSK